jgi:hypothetical protein
VSIWVGFKRIVTRLGAAVGLNGEFVPITQLGAKHLNRKRIHRQSMRKASQLDR